MFFNKNGRIDFIINSAWLLNVKLLKEKTDAEIFDEISTNYIGCLNVAKAAYHYLKLSNGWMLFFSSSSNTHGRELYSIYHFLNLNFLQKNIFSIISDGINRIWANNFCSVIIKIFGRSRSGIVDADNFDLHVPNRRLFS